MENGFDYNDKREEDSADGENEYVYKTVMDGRHNSRIWSVASVILSVFSVVCCFFGWASLIIAVLSIVFAVISRKNIGFFDGWGLTGLIIGIFGIVFSATFLLSKAFIVETEWYKEMIEIMNELSAEGGGNEV